MESSPAAAMASPPTPKSRSREPLLLGGFDLPAGWGCRRPMAFSRDAASPTEHAAAAAAVAPKNKALRSPEKGDAAGQHAPAAEEAQEAPRRQWNLRDRAAWRDYSAAEDARQHKRKMLGDADAAGKRSRGFSPTLTRREIEADFVAITGKKPPRRPKRRPKSVQKQIDTLWPGSSLSEVTRDRYKVNEKGGF
ncbi:hypothetical protein ACP70R_039516 [Stipagrostis hirtigluma subsp. patula]